LVVSPAIDVLAAASEDPSRQYSTIVQTKYGYPGMVQFENPFPNTTSGTPTTTAASKSTSAVSLASSVGGRGGEPHQSNNNNTTTTASLPYRMVDIRIDTADVAESIDDVWDNPDDVTFQPFRIRDAVRICFVFCVIFVYCISSQFSPLLYSRTFWQP
jgi:hypothetical protein